MVPFVHTALPARVVFGRGSIARPADKAAGRGGLATPHKRANVERLAARLSGQWWGIRRGTLVDGAEAALAVYAASGAQGVVSLGGGSITGLGKSIAARSGAVQIAMPTTHAESELMQIPGETVNRVKTAWRGLEILLGVGQFTSVDISIPHRSRCRPPAEARIIAVLARRLHAFAKEVWLAGRIWERGIDFLTRTGPSAAAYGQLR